jgi:phenylpyruvate tautomerase PptA (4-oxalocrotonate tautomerase family)
LHHYEQRLAVAQQELAAAVTEWLTQTLGSQRQNAMRMP